MSQSSRPVVLAATLPWTYVLNGDERLWSNWVKGAGEADYTLAVIEAPDSRRGRILDRLCNAGAGNSMIIFYDLDDGRTEITTANRQAHLVVGQNIAADWAQERMADLFMVGGGIELPVGWRERLQNPVYGSSIRGPYVPSYNLDGPPMGGSGGPDDPRVHLPAGALFVPFDLLNRGLRWRLHNGLSDDFGLTSDAANLYGVSPITLHGLVAQKWPVIVEPVENRPKEWTDLLE